ncbi:MAG TPA: T9SS type A sorting domain-containing protein, partial [Chitinophagales bacterium]|nr:T9SS type A sorting domain-containing protein [Chitinophagales bacterium]
EADASFVIYPNPSQGDFTLQIDFGADINGEASVKIYSMLGQMMYEAFIIVDNGEIDDQLNVSGQIPSGVYLIEATIDQQKLVREIVIE